MSHVMNTYARQPVALVRGQGVWLWDDAGRKYLDAFSGISFNTLGNNHRRLVRALTEQIGRVIRTSNLLLFTDSGHARERVGVRVCVEVRLDDPHLRLSRTGLKDQRALVPAFIRNGERERRTEAVIRKTVLLPFLATTGNQGAKNCQDDEQMACFHGLLLALRDCRAHLHSGTVSLGKA